MTWLKRQPSLTAVRRHLDSLESTSTNIAITSIHRSSFLSPILVSVTATRTISRSIEVPLGTWSTTTTGQSTMRLNTNKKIKCTFSFKEEAGFNYEEYTYNLCTMFH